MKRIRRVIAAVMAAAMALTICPISRPVSANEGDTPKDSDEIPEDNIVQSKAKLAAIYTGDDLPVNTIIDKEWIIVTFTDEYGNYSNISTD